MSRKAKREETFEPLYTFTKRKNALLFKAIEAEDCEKIRKLFTSKRGFQTAELEELDGESDFREVSALQYAYRMKKERALKMLLKCNVDPGDKLYYMKSSLVEDLIGEDDLETLEEILPYVKNINEVYVFDQGEYQIKTTYLGLCACLGKVGAAKLLVDGGACMKPWSTKEALERNEDCGGSYNGAINVKRYMGSGYYGPWKEQMIEPWQFSILSKNEDAMLWFFKEGSRQVSRGFSELIFHILDGKIVDQIKTWYPEQMAYVLRKGNIIKILEIGNYALLEYLDAGDIDASTLGKRCVSEEKILRSYEVLKTRLKRELTMEEKRQLVKLMLKFRSFSLIEICEKEWETEKEPCDVTEWISMIPKSGPKDRDFVKRLGGSDLRLAIHPEHNIFDERYYYFDQDSGDSIVYHCLDNVNQLAVLDKVVEVIPPEETDELIPFVTKTLDIGKKSAFQRLRKWGLIHEKNMAKVSEYIVENNLEQLYDQAIATGEHKGNQKSYQL